MSDNGWISVDERLPEPGEVVLCLVYGLMDKYAEVTGGHWPAVDSGGVSTKYYVGQLVHESGTLWANPGVTHWQPLPPPPEAP